MIHANEETQTIYTTHDDNEHIKEEVTDANTTRIEVIDTDLLWQSKGKSSQGKWTASFNCPYSLFETGTLPLLRVTSTPNSTIILEQTKLVDIKVHGQYKIDLNQLSELYGYDLEERVPIELTYQKKMQNKGKSTTIIVYPIYEVHNFTSYYRGQKEGCGSIKYPVGVLYEEVINFE